MNNNMINMSPGKHTRLVCWSSFNQTPNSSTSRWNDNILCSS